MCRTRHLRKHVFGLVIVLLAAGCVATNAVGQTPDDEPSEVCSPYASVPLPAEAERGPVPKTPPGCASYRSYRGIGRPVNLSAARACAWKERLAQKANLGQNSAEGTAWVVGGSLILADIYFNGAGVKRDIPLAMRFACESQPGMVELAQPEIAKLHGALPAHGPFEFCDYATTTLQMDFCASYGSELANDRSSRYFRSLKPSMTPEQRAAFEKLLAAENAYVDAHASEVYQGGTIRAIRTIGSQEILSDLFRTELVHFERKKWPELSDNQIQKADAELHEAYERKLAELRVQKPDAIEDGVVTADHLASVEKAWKTYRDAWVAFARVRYPVAVAAIRAEIALDRYRFIKTIY